MITKFNIFENINDPYDEENWDDINDFSHGDEVTITPKILDYISDKKMPFWSEGFIGRKTSIYDNTIRYLRGMIGIAVDANFYRVPDPSSNKTLAYFVPLDCLEKVEKVEEGVHTEIDPYDEEIWGAAIELKKGNQVIILPKLKKYIKRRK